MKTIVFLCSLFLFLVYVWKGDARSARAKEERSGGKCSDIHASALCDVYRAQEERRRIEEEYNFYMRRLDELETALQRAREEEERKQARVDEIAMYNQYGAVISSKQESKARRELYTIQQRRFTLENQIRTATKNKYKAIDTLTGER